MSETYTPLLSVIIPTHRRPHYLPRAIESALRSSPNGSVEVIVIPNGIDKSWKAIADQYVSDKRVQWHPIRKAHGNTARNHGMALATGKYLRFLDDDDYLLPNSANQVKALEDTNYDLCTGPIEVRKNSGDFIELRTPPPHVKNLTDLVISTAGMSLPLSWTYRRSIIREFSWDESINTAQDSAWLYTLAIEREYQYICLPRVIGVWIQHDEERISQKKCKSWHAKIWANMLLDTCNSLEQKGRLTKKRKNLVARRLWTIVCGAYYTDPKWWKKIVSHALHFDPQARPDLALYRLPLTKNIPPIFILNITTPLLLGRRVWRRLSKKIGIRKAIFHE